MPLTHKTNHQRQAQNRVSIDVPKERVRDVMELLISQHTYKGKSPLFNALSHTDPYDIPLYESPVSAGLPSPVDEKARLLNLNHHLIHKPETTFFVCAQGESMINAGIYDGDLLIVDRDKQPQHRDIVIASINGDFTVKRVFKDTSGFILKAENPDYGDIIIDETIAFRVLGVVTATIHRF